MNLAYLICNENFHFGSQKLQIFTLVIFYFLDGQPEHTGKQSKNILLKMIFHGLLTIGAVAGQKVAQQQPAAIPGYRYVENVRSLEVDSGWQPFKFGNYSQEVSDKFRFDLTKRGYVWVTDAYCKGDSFLVFDKGKVIGETLDVAEDGCKTNATDPTDAIQNGGFGHFQVNLTKGNHLLSFVVKNSPFLAGEGFVRLDSEYKVPGQYYPPPDPSVTTTTTDTRPTTDPTMSARCPITRSNLFIFDMKLNFNDASNMCKSLGLRFAKITSRNVIDAIGLAYDCLGQDVQMWFGEYTISHKFRFYMIRTGFARGQGSVLGNPNTEERNPFMCEVKPRPGLVESP